VTYKLKLVASCSVCAPLKLGIICCYCVNHPLDSAYTCVSHLPDSAYRYPDHKWFVVTVSVIC